MNLAYTIARRIAKYSTSGISGKIIKIAIITIALSIATMILAITVLHGFKNGISEKVFGFWGHIHITDTKINRSLELSPIADSQALKDSIANIHSVVQSDLTGTTQRKSQGGVRDIHPYIMLPAIINRKNDLEGIILKGVNHEYNWDNFQDYLKEGAFPDVGAVESTRDILISQQTAIRLKVGVGDKLVVYFLEEKESVKKSFQISGIYRTGLEEYDVKFAFLDMRIIQEVLEWQPEQVGGFEVFIEHVEDAGLIADYVYQEVLPPNLYAETIQEKFEGLFEWIELQDMNAYLLLILMTVVALINMSTALLILILERSKMVGILKAVGANNWTIRKIFIYTAVFIMGSAIILGNVLGLSIAFIQKYTGILKLDEATYYLSEVPIEFNVWSIILVNLGTIVTTLIFMIIPTYLVTRISVIKVLRFD